MRAILVALLVAATAAAPASDDDHTTCAIANDGSEVVFDCGGELISAVQFGSFGTPRGSCETGEEFERMASCHAPLTLALLEERCLGQSTCIFAVTADAFGGAPKCAESDGSKRWLGAVLTCGNTPTQGTAAAPIRPGLSTGWQVVIFIFFAFSLYCGLGVYHGTRNGLTLGPEAIPHVEMWKDLPYLVRDGFVFAVDTIKSKGRGQYESVL